METTTLHARITQLAAQSHDEWREARRRPDGTYEPRLKTVEDQHWIADHQGQTICDIANCPYQELPAEWQAESRAGAEVALKLIDSILALGYPLANAQAISVFVELTSALVHEEWLKRHPWAEAQLKANYFELPESEREKDRVFIRKALALVCGK